MSRRRHYVQSEGRELEVALENGEAGRLRAFVGAGSSTARELTVLATGARTAVLVDGRVIELYVGAGEVTVAGSHRRLVVSDRPARALHGAATTSSDALIRAPMPGRVLKVLVREGQAVSAGAAVLVVEAMKMENELLAPRAGTIKQVLVAVGAAVERDVPLVEME